MAGIKKLMGTKSVLKNLNKAIKKIKGKTATGLKEAALIVKADAVRYAPIDLSNLRGSCFIMVTGGEEDYQKASFQGDDSGELDKSHAQAVSHMKSLTQGNPETRDKIVAVVAFSAFYAWYVHEMPITYNFNQGGPKFLEKSMQKNQKRVLISIKKHARV